MNSAFTDPILPFDKSGKKFMGINCLADFLLALWFLKFPTELGIRKRVPLGASVLSAFGARRLSQADPGPELPPEPPRQVMPRLGMESW